MQKRMPKAMSWNIFKPAAVPVPAPAAAAAPGSRPATGPVAAAAPGAAPATGPAPAPAPAAAAAAASGAAPATGPVAAAAAAPGAAVGVRRVANAGRQGNAGRQAAVSEMRPTPVNEVRRTSSEAASVARNISRNSSLRGVASAGVGAATNAFTTVKEKLIPDLERASGQFDLIRDNLAKSLKELDTALGEVKRHTEKYKSAKQSLDSEIYKIKNFSQTGGRRRASRKVGRKAGRKGSRRH